jgi:hypothetical protein
MREPEGHCAGGASNVDDGNGALEFVMAGLVEEVAETDYARSFADEVYRQARRGAAEHTNHWIQFLATTLQVGTSHGEVSDSACP